MRTQRYNVQKVASANYARMQFGQFLVGLIMLFLLMTVRRGTEEADTEKEMNVGMNFSVAVATSIMLIAGVVIIVLAVIVYLSIVRCKKNNIAMVSS
ncbi:hypothetical protein M0R45_025954 [Rubus argutus]|uniref:Uncharacterized protein n=1 Tax=Rubus argutus TaxID=59490 RepID=A0AAW1WXI6_RUBAR